MMVETIEKYKEIGKFVSNNFSDILTEDEQIDAYIIIKILYQKLTKGDNSLPIEVLIQDLQGKLNAELLVNFKPREAVFFFMNNVEEEIELLIDLHNFDKQRKSEQFKTQIAIMKAKLKATADKRDNKNHK